MLFGKLLQTALLSLAAVQTDAAALRGKTEMIMPYKNNETLQDIVTWDSHSLFVRGERIMFWSGEFHPFRLPVASLYLDVFQKIKALGYNGVSFYVDWALLEGKRGVFNATGIFDLQPFFDAASEAGIYLLARPGPYINAEASGGGFPGWLSRVPALERTRAQAYLDATDLYAQKVGEIIAGAQITNGGPIILVQPENEYSGADSRVPEFPDVVYWEYVESQLRNAGIVVPLISNDAYPHGYFATGPPAKAGHPDIYGYDGYPLGFDCANPYVWPDNDLPTYYGNLHEEQASSTPNSIVEFQGGSFDPWGGLGFAQCAELLNSQFERVFYKNDLSFAMTIFNIYMTYGGTNWGNLGHPGGYTSYDYGAVIDEERAVTREKYSEAKLEANFIQASPAYYTASYVNNTDAIGSYTGNEALAVTLVKGDVTNFYVLRHAAYNSNATTDYTITLPTSKGNVTIPQLGGTLSLHGRDSKFHVTDYDISGVTLLYSSAEIFTWKKYDNKRVLVVYGGPGETHELAVSHGGHAWTTEGSGVKTSQKGGVTVVQYTASSERRIVRLACGLTIYLLDRYSAYDYWVIDLPNDPVSGNHTNQLSFPSTPIVKAGYLLRTVNVTSDCIYLTGDLNKTAEIEVIGGAPARTKELYWNGKSLPFKQSKDGVVTATATYTVPQLNLPELSKVGWKVLNSLPEIQNSYDDSKWPVPQWTYTNSTVRNLTTPTNLYASDNGFNAGSLIYRGHFTATGDESSFYLETQGGSAFGDSVWLNETFLGSWRGADYAANWNHTFTLPNLKAGANYVFTILIDHMGNDEDWTVGSDGNKNPRGVLDYGVSGRSQSDITWKLTGNLGGEDYYDKSRGPLNEGALYAERQGYHLPGAPTSAWESSALGPMEGLSSAGVNFYATTIDLDMPYGYDIPLSFNIANTTSANGDTPAFRSMVWVNGVQYGKYVNNVGPQNIFPVPEGIWNYHGSNYVCVSVWSLDASGAKIGNFSLVASPVIETGFGPVEVVQLEGWYKREGAY